MPALILDSSVTLSLAFEDECDDFTRRVFEAVKQAGALVPSLWRLEVANIMVSSVKRKRLTGPDAGLFLSLLSTQPIQVADDNNLSAAALYELALRYGLTAYDAAYLNLAEITGLPLASKDAALKAAVIKAGLKLFA
ncbi:MAG: type II toxin-antitoxin system VapC family toxin [Candidatus Adiutrix sp.]|nr:type II toxin-antitoxin system VapC family toxin [Candidatus Adiutrix sp.]